MTGGGSTLVALVAAIPQVASAERDAMLPALERLVADRHGVVVATCHRVEAYVAGPAGSLPELPGASRLEERDVAAHAISLALGLESAVLGEDQILHQLRTAVATARGAYHLDPELEALFELALSAGRRARTWSDGRPRSLADVALDLAAETAGDLAGRTVVVVGSGSMGRLAARAARRRRACVVIASRTLEHAERLAADVGATVVPFDPGDRIAGAAAVLVALHGLWSIGRPTLDTLAGIPIVVDLSQPRAIPVAAALPRVVLLDDLRPDTTPDPAAERRARRLMRLRDETLDAWDEWLAGRSAAALTRSLASRIERDRHDELSRLWRRRPDLSDTARDEIEQMTRHLAARFFRVPFARLRHDDDGRREEAARELFGL